MEVSVPSRANSSSPDFRPVSPRVSRLRLDPQPISDSKLSLQVPSQVSSQVPSQEPNFRISQVQLSNSTRTLLPPLHAPFSRMDLTGAKMNQLIPSSVSRSNSAPFDDFAKRGISIDDNVTLDALTYLDGSCTSSSAAGSRKTSISSISSCGSDPTHMHFSTSLNRPPKVGTPPSSTNSTPRRYHRVAHIPHAQRRQRQRSGGRRGPFPKSKHRRTLAVFLPECSYSTPERVFWTRQRAPWQDTMEALDDFGIRGLLDMFFDTFGDRKYYLNQPNLSLASTHSPSSDFHSRTKQISSNITSTHPPLIDALDNSGGNGLHHGSYLSKSCNRMSSLGPSSPPAYNDINPCTPPHQYRLLDTSSSSGTILDSRTNNLLGLSPSEVFVCMHDCRFSERLRTVSEGLPKPGNDPIIPTDISSCTYLLDKDAFISLHIALIYAFNLSLLSSVEPAPKFIKIDNVNTLQSVLRLARRHAWETWAMYTGPGCTCSSTRANTGLVRPDNNYSKDNDNANDNSNDNHSNDHDSKHRTVSDQKASAPAFDMPTLDIPTKGSRYRPILKEYFKLADQVADRATKIKHTSQKEHKSDSTEGDDEEYSMIHHSREDISRICTCRGGEGGSFIDHHWFRIALLELITELAESTIEWRRLRSSQVQTQKRTPSVPSFDALGNRINSLPSDYLVTGVDSLTLENTIDHASVSTPANAHDTAATNDAISPSSNHNGPGFHVQVQLLSLLFDAVTSRDWEGRQGKEVWKSLSDIIPSFALEQYLLNMQ